MYLSLVLHIVAQKLLQQPIRDYHTEAETFLKTLDENFKIEQTTLYSENAPTKKDTVKEKVEQADEKVKTLTADARKAQFEADCLSLARDVAQIANAYKEVEKTEHAVRTERIAHLRGQNVIGAAVVADHMSNHMAVHAGPCKEQMALAEKAQGRLIFIQSR